ncbi:MAG: glucose ABC transporter substrate-binding protein GlcS [Nitrososphaeria archaeon]
MSQEKSGNVPSAPKKGHRNLWIAIIIIIVVVVGGGFGGYYYYESTRVPSVTTVDFYTWWGGADGGQALSYIEPAFHAAYPKYTMTTTVSPGAGGTNAKYAIVTLISAGTPPSTFQTHMGPEMLSYVEIAPKGINSFVDMTPIAKSMGLLNPSVAVPAVMEAGSFNGTLLSLPVDVGRSSMLYFNPQTLRKYNLPIPTTLSQLLYDSQVLYEHGIYWAIPGGDGGWDQENVWESLLLYYGGPQAIDELDYGTLNINSPAVINATNTFIQLMKYNYPGALSEPWTVYIADIVGGTASFQVNGDWYDNFATYLVNPNEATMGPGTPYPAIPPYTSWTNISLMCEPFPGTSSVFSIVIDSVAVPVGKSQTAGLTLAQYWSSYAGQKVWTPYKMVSFYQNGTDWYSTPAQWADFQALKSTPANEFVYAPSDGGLFDDASATFGTACTVLSETLSPSTFYPLLSQTIAEEHADWMAAAKLGLGYLGMPGSPFGGYYPPWVSSSA